MPDLLFGITRKSLSNRCVKKLDTLCKQLGGKGFVWGTFEDGPKGWFVAPNQGYPFDRELRLAVLEAAKKEGFTP